MFKTFLALSAALIVQQTSAAIPKTLEAEISSFKEKNIKGDVIFEYVPEGVRVKAHVVGLVPNSRHGFHVHENGECAGPDYKTAGGHLNPANMRHGSPASSVSHMGDLGNLVANEKGEAHVDRILNKKEAAQIMELKGKAVLIHAKGDDLQTQPAGDAGGRIACGVIESI